MSVDGQPDLLWFTRLTAEGSPYRAGALLAEFAANGGELSFNILDEEAPAAAVEETLVLIRAFDPAVEEEIMGAADALGIPPGRLLVFSPRPLRIGGCSHFCALPPATRDGHVLVGRSYEFVPQDELNLVVLREEGLPAHLGFSLLLFGRMDGVNGHGLSVTMSSCEYPLASHGRGLWFPLVLRFLLDRCRTVEEACRLLREIPFCCNVCLLLADRGGHARVAELACLGDDRRLLFRDATERLIATNHFIHPGMADIDRHRGSHSELRYGIIERALEKRTGSLGPEDVHRVLSRPLPAGVACSHYRQGLGTLRSMAADLTEGAVDICFGSPAVQEWTRVALDGPCGASRFQVPFMDAPPEDPAGLFGETAV